MGTTVKLVAFVALLALTTGGPSLGDDNFCQGCRSLVSYARQFNTTDRRSENMELFKGYCELYYPASTDYQQGPCPLFIEALNYIFDHIDPVHHCDQIGACGRADGEKLAVSQPSDDIYEYMRSSNNNNNVIKPLDVSSKKDNVICEFCEQMVTQAKNMLNDPAAINQLKQQLDGFCEFLSVIGEDQECRQFIDNYMDELFTFIQNLDPEQYCQSLALCPAKQVLGERQQATRNQLANLPSLADFQNFGIETSVIIGEKPGVLIISPSSISKTNHRAGPACMLCQTVVKELFKFVRANETEANIINGLEHICGLVYKPGTDRDQCDSMVKAYTREIVQLMIDETDPQMICMLLGQCVYQSDPTTSLAPTDLQENHNFGLADLITALSGNIEYKSAESCLECRMFIKFLRQKLGDEKTQTEIESWLLANLCQQLPGKGLIDSCSSMIKRDSSTFFNAVRGALNPRESCRKLGVCSAKSLVSLFSIDNLGLSTVPLINSVRRAPSASNINRPNELRGQMCEQCVEIVTQIDEYLANHPIDQDVSVIIDKVCNNLPDGTVRGECTYIMKTFGEEIMQAISNMDNPRQLCSKIYLCQASQA